MLIDDFRYQYAHETMGKVTIDYSYYIKAYDFLKPGGLNEFAEALGFK